MAKLKKYRIMKDVFRNRLGKYDRISDIISGTGEQQNKQSYLIRKVLSVSRQD